MINTDGFTGHGQKHSNKYTGQDYATTTLQEIYTMALNPPSVDKDNAQWVVFSTEHGSLARNLDYQLGSEGAVNCLWLDFDKGGESTETISQALHTITGGAWFLLYHTRSSTAAHNKHRAIIPLLHPVPTLAYKAYSTALNNLAERYGLQPDRITQTVTQLCYLPNRGEHYPTPYANDGQRWDIDPNGAMALEVRTEHAAYMKLMEERRQQQARFAEQGGKVEGDHSFHAAFREEHPSEEILELYGFTTLNGIDWKHPEHDGNSYSTRLMPDGALYTLSSTVGAWGGVQAGEGWYMQDGFDLYVHFTCNGDRAMGETYARSLVPLVEAKLWSAPGNTLIQNALAEHRAEQERLLSEAEAKVTALQNAPAVDLLIEGTDDDGNWDMPTMPEGLAKDLYHTILNKSLLPVPQFAFASMINLCGALVGDRYHLDNTDDGVVTYMMLVADTGVGKTEGLDTTKDLFRQAAIKAQQPAVFTDIMSSSISVSGPAVHTALTNSNRLALFEDDAATLITRMVNNKASDQHAKEVRDKLLQLWSQNKKNGTLSKRDYSKAADTKGVVERPAMTVGLGIQLSSFKQLIAGNGSAALGFMNRFFVAKYDGMEQRKQKDAKRRPIDPQFLERLAALIRYVQQLTDDKPIAVPPEVLAIDEAYDEHLRTTRNKARAANGGEADESLQAISRMPQQVLRLAGLLSVINNCTAPAVTVEMYEFARSVFELSSEAILSEYTQGAAAGEDAQLRASMCAFLTNYFAKSWKEREKPYKTPRYMYSEAMGRYISESVLFEQCQKRAAFKNSDSYKSSEELLQLTVRQLVARDMLVQLKSQEVKAQNPLVKGIGNQNFYMLGQDF